MEKTTIKNVTFERAEELKKLAQPLSDFLYKYYHPHATILIDQTHCEVLVGDMVVPLEVKD
jgi:hypothetical protein